VSRTVYLHVGIAKTGTTYLQRRLFANRELLERHGTLYPGSGPAAHFLASLDLRGTTFKGHAYEGVEGAWDRLVAAADGFGGNTLISHETLARAKPAHRPDEHDAGARWELRQRPPGHQEVRAQVDREHVVPDLRGCPLELDPGSDTHVEHDAVDSPQDVGSLINQALTGVGVSDIGHDTGRGAPTAFDQANGFLRSVGDDVDDGDRGPLSGGKHRDRLTVARWASGVTNPPAAAADHHDPAAGEAGSPVRGSCGRGRKAVLVAHVSLLC